jgi:uncharacterized protein involved in type VI secretion and phage assembly
MATDPNTQTVTELAKRAERQLHGKYRATVYQNDDPERRGRLRLLIPSIFRKEPTDWVQGAFPIASASKEAFIMVPEEKSHVLVEFIEGDRSAPVWTAAYYPDKPQKVDVPTDFDLKQGTMHLLRTRSGIAVRMEDDGDKTQVLVIAHPGGGEVRIDKDGITTIKDQGGAMVQMDPKAKVTKVKGHGDNGGLLNMTEQMTTLGHGSVKIELSSSGITATAPLVALDGDSVTLGKGAASPILDAQAFAVLFDGHTNPPGAISPTPLSPVLMGMSLKKVKGA